MRTVQFEAIADGVLCTGLGKFHQWGTGNYLLENKLGNISLAIIEDMEGRVFTCLPSKIKFLDGEKQGLVYDEVKAKKILFEMANTGLPPDEEID